MLEVPNEMKAISESAPEAELARMIEVVPSSENIREVSASNITVEMIDSSSVPVEVHNKDTSDSRASVEVDPSNPNVFLNIREIAARSHLMPELSPGLTSGKEVEFIGSAIKAAREKSPDE